MVDIKENLNNLIDTIKELPSLPIIVTQLIQTINNEKSSAIDVAKIISNDQAVTSKILRLVNSAYFGFQKKITTVQHAISILGFDTIRSIALSLSVFEDIKGDLGLFNKESFWAHSIGTAVSSRELAKIINMEDLSGTAFVCGLLHDIGKLIEFKYFINDFNNVVRLSAAQNICFYEAEMQIFRISHTEIGYKLGTKWDFPDEICIPILHHHTFTDKFNNYTHNERILIAIVHLANIISKSRNFGYSGYEKIPDLLKEYYEVLQVNRQQLGVLIERTEDEFNKSLELLKII
ncbi:MAG: HDOD domain-containing protein [Candidatus Hydrogenedentota bacterium]